ncbi:MAG TPA: chorismate mutase [Solirubrobacteraceae bacterium]|jgi:chorismate mutase-like protein|nr:chorismate mutase [Solirubrobacteraceae bacterium]
MSSRQPNGGGGRQRPAHERPRPGSAGGAGGLAPFRQRLDELDEQIARLFGERFAICRDVALYKREHDIPMMQPQRVAEVRSRYLARGAEVALPADFIAELFELLIDATCRMEDELIEAPFAQAEEEIAALADPDEAIAMPIVDPDEDLAEPLAHPHDTIAEPEEAER